MTEGRGGVTGWKLDEDERAALLARFQPEWPDVIADHVTFDMNAGPEAPLPYETSGEIVGAINDEAGLQALVVAVGNTTARPDGSTYHITWSLDRGRGREPIQSNDVIAKHGWRPLDGPIPIALIPARWP
ncbi:MAG: hypothetical protein ACTHM0_09740 [Sphingomonas sp.]